MINSKAQPRYSFDDISEAINKAVMDIGDRVQVGERMTDAMNLLINATLTYIDAPNADLETVARECYAIDLDDYNEEYPYAKDDPRYDAEEVLQYEADRLSALDVIIGWIEN